MTSDGFCTIPPRSLGPSCPLPSVALDLRSLVVALVLMFLLGSEVFHLIPEHKFCHFAHPQFIVDPIFDSRKMLWNHLELVQILTQKTRSQTVSWRIDILR